MTNRETKLLTVVGVLCLTILPWSLFIDSSNIEELERSVSEKETNYAIMKTMKIPSEKLIYRLVKKANGRVEKDHILVFGEDRALNLIKALEEYNYPIKTIQWDGKEAKITSL